MTKKVTLISRGDNNWEKEFNSRQEAIDYMFSLLGKVFTYFNAESGGFVFDIEDDCITMINIDGSKKYCAGWHWIEEQDKPQIMATEKTSFYELFTKLEG